MTISKNFENKDSKSERTDSQNKSGSPTFDVLSLLGMPSAKDIEKGIKSGVNDAVDGLKHLVGQAEKHSEAKPLDDAHSFSRGSLLNAPHHDSHQQGVLMGRLLLNESAEHHNPSHLSAFLLKRIHDGQSQTHNVDSPAQFEQQQSHETHGTQWQEANYNFRQSAADVVLQAAKPLASLAPGADLNPNLGADEGKLREMGLPYTRSVDKDMRPFFEHVVRPIVMRQPEKFHTQLTGESHNTNLPYGGIQHYSQMQHNNYFQTENNYHAQGQHLPYGGFQTHVPHYYRRSV